VCQGIVEEPLLVPGSRVPPLVHVVIRFLANVTQEPKGFCWSYVIEIMIFVKFLAGMFVNQWAERLFRKGVD